MRYRESSGSTPLFGASSLAASPGRGTALGLFCAGPQLPRPSAASEAAPTIHPQQRGRGCRLPPPSKQQPADTLVSNRTPSFRGVSKIEWDPTNPPAFLSFLLTAGARGADGARGDTVLPVGQALLDPCCLYLGAGGRGSAPGPGLRATPQLAEPTGRKHADSFVGHPGPHFRANSDTCSLTRHISCCRTAALGGRLRPPHRHPPRARWGG